MLVLLPGLLFRPELIEPPHHGQRVPHAGVPRRPQLHDAPGAGGGGREDFGSVITLPESIVYPPGPVKRRLHVLERRIERIKRGIGQLGDLRPGSLSQQYNVCGVPGCRCKASPPQRHGPYYQLSISRKGKDTSRFVRRDEVATVKRQLRNFARLRTPVDEWIDLGMELSVLRIEADRDRAGK